MLPQDPEWTDEEDVKVLLKGIFTEMKNIGVHLARQSDQIEQLQAGLQAAINLQLTGTGMRFGPRTESILIERLSITPPNQTLPFSRESRLGPILEQGLERYRSNAVPHWSTLYGTHLTNDEHIDVSEETIRNSEWTSITGDCWRIPHDNRVTFCFLAPLSDSTILIKVRNFLLHFHKLEDTEMQRGSFFNVWDWFDTGISAYWCPGNGIPRPTQGSVNCSKAEEFRESCGDPVVLSPLVAPWRRIINLQGLTTLSNCEESFNQEDLSSSDLCPFLFSDSSEAIFHQPTDEMIWGAVECHLRCQRAVDTHYNELETKGCILFHITFFEILLPASGRRLTELWPCGDLHSDIKNRRKPRQIRESALTIMAIPTRDLPSSKFRAIFWTIICLRPFQFPHLYYSEKSDDLTRRRTHEMIDEMSYFIHKALLAVLSRWEEIAGYFDEILSEKKGLLNPKYHDSLLTDDGAFSRSKKYFWAIGFLEEAGTSISDNIYQVERFVELMKLNPPLTATTETQFQLAIKKHCNTIQKLHSLRMRFRHKKEEAMALRDGLFSASAVMESRTSTQLGENVRLLTFVSIFFLPLSFCTSFWSINNLFSLSSLAIAMPVVSICTYIAVFNLDNIAPFFKPTLRPSLIQNFRNSQIKAMRNDSNDVWKERGAALSDPDKYCEKGGGPSSWRILQFAVRRLFLGTWSLLLNIWKLLCGALLRGRRVGVYSDQDQPASIGNLGDIRVRVQVDVESCKESWEDIEQALRETSLSSAQ